MFLGKEVVPQRLTSGGAGYWGRGKAVLGDRVFWRQHGFVLARTLVGWPLAVGAVSLAGSALWFVFLPIYIRGGLPLDAFDMDTASKALLGKLFGIAGLLVALALVHWTARGWRRLVFPLLGPARRPATSFFVPHVVAVPRSWTSSS